MFSLAVRCFRPIAIPIFAAFLVLSLPQAEWAQDETATAAAVLQQANTTLVAQVKSGAVPTANTRVTLVTRHEKLIEIFANHPELARTYALDAGTRASLLKAQPSFAALIEQDVPLTGQLTSSVADDFVHHTSTIHYSLHAKDGDRGLSFTSIPSGIDHLVGRNVTVTGLSLPEVMAAESMRSASREAAAALTPSVGPPVASLVRPAFSAPLAGPGVPAGSATLLESPLGNQTTAVLILNFTGGTATYPTGWNQAPVYNQMFNGPATPNIAGFMNEVSYGQTTVQADIYGPISVPGTFTCNTTDAMATAAVAAAAPTVDFSKYNHIMFVYPVASCYFGGLGSTGPVNATAAIPHQFTYIWQPVTPDFDITSAFRINFQWLAINHEFGHNLGLNHGNSLDFGALSLGPLDYTATAPGVLTPGGHAAANSASVSDSAATPSPAALNAAAAAPSGSTRITAVNTEYGELFSNMGDGQAPFPSEQHVKELGWIPASGNQDVTSSGSFTIFPDEVSTGLRTLHVLRDAASSSWIWVEFHQSLGVYTPLAFTLAPYNVPNNVLSGAQLHYQDGFYDQLHTLLLDMNPVGPTGTPNSFFNSNLTPGSSWSDPFSLLTITTGAQSANSLGVSVSYDTPCATVALDTATIPTAGGAGVVTLTAPSTCNWSVSSNASWISFPGATTGSGNGTVSYISTANTTAAQRNSYITAQRQSLPIVQPGKGVSILNRTPVSAPAGSFVPLVFNIVDNLGYADLSELDITIKGGTQPDCSITTSSSTSGGVPSNSDVYFTLTANGITSAYGDTGVAGVIANSYCSIDAGASSYSANGKTATLTLMVSFPATYAGVHSVYGVGYGSTSGISVPLSYVNVTAAGPGTSAQTPAVMLRPVSAVTPATGAGDVTIPFTIRGANTNFTASSFVTTGEEGVSAKNVAIVNATTITGDFVVKSTAMTGSRPVTVTTGGEVYSTSFLVKAAAQTPVINLAPASAAMGSTVAVSITGTNTNFTASSTVTFSGTRAAVKDVTFVSATQLTAIFVLDNDADAGARTVTVTSGSEVDTATFNVNPAPIPHVVAVPATGNQGDTVAIAFAGTDTNFTDATTLKIDGTDIKVKDISALSTTSLAVHLVIGSTATAGARMLTITTGTEIVKVNFTVTAYAPTTTAITAASNSILETAGDTLTITVKPTTGTGAPTGYVSFLETKDGGLESILGSVALSNGTASLPISGLTVGVHSFYAQYLGDNASFAQSKSTADAKVTVTADAGSVVLAETATLQMLANGSYEAIVTISNTGTGTAQKVMMTAATLGGVASVQTLPVTLPDIAPGGSISTLFDFPASAGTPGSASALRFSGTYTGGNFSGSARLTLPTTPAQN